MTLLDARDLLDQVKAGTSEASPRQIIRALCMTGDIDDDTETDAKPILIAELHDSRARFDEPQTNRREA